MKYCVEFPSVSYQEGPESVIRLAKAIEEIGYDRIEIFDHVIMGHDTPTRPLPRYPSKMPIMEALITLSFIASHTSKIGLVTEVLVLPQRQPVLVASKCHLLICCQAVGCDLAWELDGKNRNTKCSRSRLRIAVDVWINASKYCSHVGETSPFHTAMTTTLPSLWQWNRSHCKMVSCRFG